MKQLSSKCQPNVNKKWNDDDNDDDTENKKNMIFVKKFQNVNLESFRNALNIIVVYY